jgi:hypothetical protein
MPHFIRLRGPWQYEPLARTVLRADGASEVEAGELPPAGRVRMPCDWGESLGSEFRGLVRYTRRFHRPTGLGPGQVVWLAIEQVDTWAKAMLNGHLLGELRAETTPARFDVTRLLRDRNQLSVEVELPRQGADSAVLDRPTDRDGKPGGLVGEVRLEIGGN